MPLLNTQPNNDLPAPTTTTHAPSAASVQPYDSAWQQTSLSPAMNNFLNQAAPTTSSPLVFNQLPSNSSCNSGVNNSCSNYWQQTTNRYQNAYANQYQNYNNYAAVAAAVAAVNGNYTPNVYNSYQQNLYTTSSPSQIQSNQTAQVPSHIHSHNQANMANQFYSMDGNANNQILNQLAVAALTNISSGKITPNEDSNNHSLNKTSNASLLANDIDDSSRIQTGSSNQQATENDSGFDTFNETQSNNSNNKNKLINQTVGSISSSSSELSSTCSSSPSSSPKVLSHSEDLSSSLSTINNANNRRSLWN